MEIKDNVIKAYLKNVYFVTGIPLGGKTTISRALAEKYGYVVYDVDEAFARHKKLSNDIDQSAMNKEFANADEFLLRPYKEYGQWIVDNTREQLDFIILDLIKLSEKQIVLCDIHLTLDEVMRITEPERVVFLLRNPQDIIDDYCNRPDHDGFKKFIESASDFSLAKENCNKALEYANKGKYESIKKSQYFWLERDENSTIENTVQLVAKHFGFDDIV